jgi:uncharacterized membrane protein
MDRFASKRVAQQRVDRIRAFQAELEELRREGALELTGEQQQRLDLHVSKTLDALAARFDVDTTESEKRISWGMRIASTVAGLALCAAVVLFFYRIWGSLSIPAQIAILAATPLLCVAAMEFSASRERTFYYTSLIGIVAFAAAVMNLNALGAMFNVAPSANAFLVWAVFGLGLAYAYRLKLLLAASLVCTIGFTAMTLTRWSGLYWAAIDSRVETVMAGGAVVFAIPSILKHREFEEFPWVYRIIGLLAVFVGILFVSLNGSSSYMPFRKQAVEITYQMLGLGIAALAMWQGVTRRVPGIVNLGAAFFALYLYIRLFRWWWDWMPKYLFFLIIGLISLGLLYVFQHLRKRIREAHPA